MFSKNKVQKITTIDQKINDFEPYDFSNVKIKAMKEGEMKDKNRLKLKEFTVTDDGETLIHLISFQDLIESDVENCDYTVSNIQLVTFQNRNMSEDENILNIESDGDPEVEVVEEEKIRP